MVLNNFDEIKLSKEILSMKKNQKKFYSDRGYKYLLESLGQGKPIIFLHGGYGSWKHWLKQINFFSKKIFLHS